jgi:type II secretory pathway component PulF
MPYFKWRGVDITGSWHGGRSFAPSREMLDTQLFKRGIALIVERPVSWRWFYRALTDRQKMQIFRELAILLQAGILLPDALQLMGNHGDHPYVQEVLCNLAHDVERGISLSEAIGKYSDIFDAIMVHQICVGEESGNLAGALEAISESIQMTNEFKEQVRSALAIPLMTIGVFIGVFFIIFMVIIPRFAQLFKSMHHTLPPLTLILLRTSAFISSWYGITLCGLLAAFAVGLWRIGKTTRGTYRLQEWALRVPFIGRIIRNWAVATFAQSVGLLLTGGMRVVPALKVVSSTMQGSFFEQTFKSIEKSVEAGKSLSEALEQQGSELFTPDVIAMVTIGQESGQLPALLKKVATSYHGQIRRQLAMITMLIQPILLIMLGLLVTMLIMAVYGPIFTMASVV